MSHVQRSWLRQLISLNLFRGAIVFAAPLCFLGIAPLCVAQNRNAGEIRGTVQDASGGAVPSASVEATNLDTGLVTHAVSNGSGLYDMPYVVPGNYSVSFTKDGYQKSIQDHILLHVETITVNGNLQVGSISQSVQVESIPPLLQTETSELNVTLTPQLVTELPNVGGDWRNYTEMLPGVATGRYNVGSGGGLASGAYVVINGAQSTQMSYLLDGGAAITPVAGDPLNITPPLDAISEVNISTGVFGAESGNGTSVFNVITKGGTNSFHGALWERIQNDAFQARPYQQTTRIAPLRWNQYGGAIGGPILRDKLFFFVSVQRNPSKAPASQLYYVPTAAERGGYFEPAIFGTIYDPATERVVNGQKVRDPFPNNTIPTSRLDPVALAIQNYYPAANQAPDANNNNYRFVQSTPVSIDQYSYRFDYAMTQNNRIYASGLYSPSSYQNPYPGNPTGYFNYNQIINTSNGQLTDAWTISPSIVNEARFAISHGHEHWDTPDTNVLGKLGLTGSPIDVFPHINISGGPLNPYGINGDLFAYIDDNLYSLSDSVTWIAGKHTLKFGGEWDKVTAATGFSQITAGNFNFSGIATSNPSMANSAQGAGGLGYADFLLGDVSNWNIYIPVYTRTTSRNVQAYIQDYYKMFSNLTLNFGLRMIYQGGFDEEHDRFSSFLPNLLNPATNTLGAIGYGGKQLHSSLEGGKYFFEPRFGFSYGFKPGWQLRGGFGLYNIPWTSNNFTNGLGNGYSAQNSLNSPTNSYDPVFQLKNGAPPPIYPNASNLTPDAFNGQGVPYQPYDTPIGYMTEYQFGVQRQIGGYLFDVAYVGSKGTHLGWNPDLTQIPQGQLGSSTHPYPQFSNIYASFVSGTSHYDAVQVQTKKQFSNGLSYQISYTYAKNLDTGTGQGGFGTGPEIYQNAYNPGANYGPSVNDLKHTFNGGLVYELPFGQNRHFLNQGGVTNAVLGGWQVSSVFQAHSGTPFTPLWGDTDVSGKYSGGNWFPNKIGTGKVSSPTLHEWFNPNDFVQAAPNTFGNTGRNCLYGPGFVQVDLSAAKKFQISKLGERTNLEFKADAFNALNHPNWGQPNSYVHSSPGQNDAAGAGSISSFYPMRNMQLSGTIHF